MYEIYELLFNALVPKRMIRLVETLVSTRMLTWMLVGTVVYSAALVASYFLQLLGHLCQTETREESSMSLFWRIATLAFLIANVHLRFAIGS